LIAHVSPIFILPVFDKLAILVLFNLLHMV